MTSWNAKLHTSFDQRPRPRFDSHRHGNLRPMEEDKAPWWMVATFIVAGAYGLAIWL